MSDASLIATKIVRPGSLLIRRKRRGVFTILLEALYHSRRLQAERTLRRYQHLIAPAQANVLRELGVQADAPEKSGD